MKMKCAECGYEIDLVKEDGFVVDNLPKCRKCNNGYWKVSGNKQSTNEVVDEKN